MKPLLFVALVAIFAGLSACSKTEPAPPAPAEQGLSQEIKAKISALGFSPDEAYAADGGYIVEGDIFLSEEDLSAVNPVQSLIVGDVEHYRTTNLVTGLPRNIRVRYTGTTTSISNAINAAIARYNARGLRITFTRVTTTPYHITVSNVSGTDYIASAGFPSGGNPFNSIKFNTAYAGWNANTLTTVIAHEMGHCVGFRHTDYMDRSYSCGGAYSNEGTAGVGAIHIPGTPTGPSATSWMLACINNGINRPFTASDNVALDYVY